jgi:hypothetical protein
MINVNRQRFNRQITSIVNSVNASTRQHINASTHQQPATTLSSTSTGTLLEIFGVIYPDLSGSDQRSSSSPQGSRLIFNTHPLPNGCSSTNSRSFVLAFQSVFPRKPLKSLVFCTQISFKFAFLNLTQSSGTRGSSFTALYVPFFAMYYYLNDHLIHNNRNLVEKS